MKRSGAVAGGLYYNQVEAAGRQWNFS
jgi:hypothetical protein